MDDTPIGSKKHNPHEDHENNDRWLVSYADFITLLFAFFVVMYATSTNNQEKQKEFQKSVRINLKLVGNGGGDGSGADSGEFGGTNSAEALIPLEGFPARGGPREVQDYLERFVDKKLDKEDKEKIQEMRHDTLGVHIALASAQFFNLGGTKIKVSALPSLDKIADMLKQSDRKIVIEGHTDNTAVAPNAPYESNWELASLRATSLVKYLIKYHQIDPKRISATSYGDTRPLQSNDTEEGRAKNRRIEIYLVLDEKLQNQ
jgi:chemotaxis protein MotB